MKRFAIALTGLALALSVASAEAQQAPRQAIAINPIGAVFKIYSGEIERSVLRNTSIGVSSGYWSADMGDESVAGDVSYFTVDGKLRYYPGGRSLQGFSFGGSVGYAALSGSLTDEQGKATGHADAIAAGVILDYNWLLGERQRFLIGTGIGAKRLFPIGIETDGISIAYPTLRLSVGYAF